MTVQRQLEKKVATMKNTISIFKKEKPLDHGLGLRLARKVITCSLQIYTYQCEWNIKEDDKSMKNVLYILR